MSDLIPSMGKFNGKDDYGTPRKVFEDIEKYADTTFLIDACASDYNYKCDTYYSKIQNMFNQQLDKPTFMNPIYGKKGYHIDKKTGNEYFNEYGTEDFIKFARDQHFKHDSIIAVLVFANVSSSKYFTNYVGETPLDRAKNECEVYFYPKRVCFEDEKGTSVGTPSLSSMIIIYDKRFALHY